MKQLVLFSIMSGKIDILYLVVFSLYITAIFKFDTVTAFMHNI